MQKKKTMTSGRWPRAGLRCAAILLSVMLLAQSSGAVEFTPEAKKSALAQPCQAPSASSNVKHDLAPTGKLRASINVGNPLLASRDFHSGAITGLSVDLAAKMACAIGVPLSLVAASSAEDSVRNVSRGAADIGFFAIDPARANVISFSPPYLQIEGSYMVSSGSRISSTEEVDRHGVVVGVSKGSAYDLYLSRKLVNASVLRFEGARGVFEALKSGQIQAAAGIRPQLAQEMVGNRRLRLLDGHFMLISQAIGIHVSLSNEASQFVAKFVDATVAAKP